MPPLSGDNHGWVIWLCVRSQCQQISRMRTFDENSCAISITSPRSLSSPRTQHVWWDHTMGLPGKVPAYGTQCECGVCFYTCVLIEPPVLAPMVCPQVALILYDLDSCAWKKVFQHIYKDTSRSTMKMAVIQTQTLQGFYTCVHITPSCIHGMWVALTLTWPWRLCLATVYQHDWFKDTPRSTTVKVEIFAVH